MGMWGDIFTAAIPAVVSGSIGILGNSISQDREDENRENQLADQREQNILDLRLQALKAAYGSGGGGGGYRPDPNKLTAAERVSAVQNQGDSQQTAIANLIAGMQNAYGG